MSQVSLVIVLLFAFGERKRGSTLGACDLDVWHELFSMSGLRPRHSLLRDASESPFRFYWLLTSGVGKSMTLKPFAYGACVSDRFKWAEFTPSSPWVQSLFEVNPYRVGARVLAERSDRSEI